QAFRKGGHFFIQRGEQVAGGQRRERVGGGGLDRGGAGPAGGLAAGLGGQPQGDGVQPAGDGIPPADGAGLPCQHQERGLKPVLGVVVVAQGAAASCPHHRPVPLHQDRERRLVVLGGVATEQVAVGTLLGE